MGTYFDIQNEFGDKHSKPLDTICHTLNELFDKVREAMNDLDPALKHVLMDSGGSDDSTDIEKQIETRQKCLRSAQCSVIVAGETNAGKSTFLNLLLGMDILPISIFSCTAAICVLKYSPTLSAEIVYRDGRRRKEKFADVAEAKVWLTNTVAEKDQDKREQGLDIETINIFVPAVVLQSGVTLVDTPGIGENETMYNCTMNYVKGNNAAAYVYVIKTDNAGGVHDDRLLEFLRAILEHKERDKTSDIFDSSSAMFVCNRWDTVPQEQRERVKDNALSKFKDVWPKFNPSQAFFVSSTDAQMHNDVDPRYVTEDFETVLKGLKEVFVKARRNAVNQHYRWLKQLLHHSTSFLQTTIHQCSQTDEQLIERFRLTKDKLEALQKKTTDTTETLRLQVKEEMLKLCGKIAEILTQAEVQNELKDWSHHPFPPAPSLATDEIKRWQEEVDTLIMRRIIEKVDEELTRHGWLQELQDELKVMTQRELKLVDDEINSIIKDMTDRSSLGSSQSSSCTGMSVMDSDSDSVVDMVRAYKERNDASHLPGLSSVVGAYDSTARRPSVAMASVPKLMFRSVLASLSGILNAVVRLRRRSAFSTNPEDYMKDRMAKISRVVSENLHCQLQMAAKYHEKFSSFIVDVDNSIPRFITSNKQVMEDIRANRRKYHSQHEELVATMENLEPVREMLRGFGSLYIRDLTADNICFMLDKAQRRQSVAVSVIQNDPVRDSGLGASMQPGEANGLLVNGSSSGRTTQGLWSKYQWGHVVIGEDHEQVIGRAYIQGLHEETLIKEIARLRCLRCKDVAPFLGMSRIEDSAVFLFMGDLRSAHRFLGQGFHEPHKSVPHLLEGVLRGLMYLHREGLVHMELSLNTVMVNREGDPKLCGPCLPRHARFPPDADNVSAEPFVCLSPEVLRGECYTPEDDFYSFGLVVWEACLRSKPYSNQRNVLSLAEFRNHVQPSSMLELRDEDNLSKVLSHNEALSAILRGCLLPARGLRIKVEELREKVTALRNTYNFPQYRHREETQERREQRGMLEKRRFRPL
ncbi:hypothetical protein V1264_021151 [Littorina saxatilis]|uniref:Protein kinase domain-containing protein n=1 Tax=Littorina saxatilis TaxID=31220 RepID=A0AAN9BBL8_9CAEN